MRRIKVVVRHGGSGLFHEALVKLLASVPDFRVYTPSSEQGLEDLLRQRHPEVLIVESPGQGTAPEYRRYFAHCPELMIIVLDPGGIETIVMVRNTGSDLLIRLIRTLGAATDG